MLGYLLSHLIKSSTHFEAPPHDNLISPTAISWHSWQTIRIIQESCVEAAPGKWVRSKQLLPVDLPDYQKRTMKVSKLFCEMNRDKYFQEERHSASTVCQRMGTDKSAKKKSFRWLKWSMLRYEMKERAKTGDKLRIYKFHEVKKFK